jgi:hypothetical protein
MALKLPRLQRTISIAGRDGKPALEFHQWWARFAENIEDAFNQLAATVDAIAAAQAAADAANAAAAAADAAAVAAQSAATGAQDAADTAAAQTNLVNSYPGGLTLGATDAGTDASISISAHTRVYADGTSVSVNSGALTGLAYSTLYYVYYDDADRTGGAVSYASTTSGATAAQIGDRHLVGAVTTPAGGGGPTTGDGVEPPGVGNLP